jgi:hypothetical protein
MKRIISMLLLIAMLTVTLVACEADEGEDQVETTPANGEAANSEETTAEYMPAKDLGGYVFRVLHGNLQTGMVPDDDYDDTSIVAQAQIKRDAEVKGLEYPLCSEFLISAGSKNTVRALFPSIITLFLHKVQLKTYPPSSPSYVDAEYECASAIGSATASRQIAHSVLVCVSALLE